MLNKAQKTRPIEMLLAWDDNTWSTAMIDIPADTPEGSIDTVAVDAAISLFGRSDTSSVLVLAAVYHLPEEDE